MRDFKALDTTGVKIVVGTQVYLATSNGELLIV